MEAEIEGTGRDGGDIPGDPLHPAARAWMEFSPRSPCPDHIEVLKKPRRNGKSAVYNIGRVGPGSMEVVAKELWADPATVERTMYCDVLPNLSVSGPTFIGSTESVEDSKVWLFLEAVARPPSEQADRMQRELATRWLATFHAETWAGSLEVDLPRRGPEYHESLLLQSIDGLAQITCNPMMSPAGRRVLGRISGQMQMLHGDWAGVAEIYTAIPVAVVHGDFKDKNMGFVLGHDGHELRVFDWSEAHWGPVAIDLWATDTSVYQHRLQECGLAIDLSTIEQWKKLGVLLRLISAIFWEIPRRRFEWLDRPKENMALYERRLRSSIADSILV